MCPEAAGTHAAPVIRHVGVPVRRREDPRLLTGLGRYLDEAAPAGALAVAFVRSPHAHARIAAVETAGVPGAFSAAGLPEARPIAPRLDGPGFAPTAQWPLSRDRVRYVGEPVAAVVAPTRYAAEDLAERVAVRYTPLDAAATVEAALGARAPRLHDHLDNVLYRSTHAAGDPDAIFRAAEVVVRAVISTPRATAVPLETRGVAARSDGGALTVWTSTQSPSLIRAGVAGCLGLPERRVRVIVPDTGGGFGQKMHLYPEEVVVAALALRTGRAVKWLEDRRENLTAATQAREERVDAELAARRDGTVLALRARVLGDVGAYHVFPTTAALEPLGVAQILPGPYGISHYAYEVLAVGTNKAPTGAFRGVGMTVGVLVMERLIDLLAHRLGLDPAEVRRRNLIPAEALPYRSASGLLYDSGSFREALERVCALGGYRALREDQRRARAAGRCVGIGLSCYAEYTGMGSGTFSGRGMRDVPGHEAAAVRADASGAVRVALSFPSQGQGHETTMAQLAAEVLQVPLDRVRVERVDTATGPQGSGTFASRAAVAGGGAVLAAAAAVRERARAIAAGLLEAAVADVELAGGAYRVRGAPGRSVTLEQAACAAGRMAGGAGPAPAPGLGTARPGNAPPRGAGSPRPGVEAGGPAGAPESADGPAQPGPAIEAIESFDPPPATFANAAHLAAVEVDRDTGSVRLRCYAVAEDCGRVLNPLIVEGQIHGALAQGIGGALLEHAAYDAAGQPLAATLMDYLVPGACEMPEITVAHLEHPAPGRPGGFKGMGEGGTIGALAAVANAVSDAVGAEVTRLPLTPEIVHGLLRGATGE